MIDINISQLVQQSWQTSEDHGFHKDRHDGLEYDSTKLMLVVGEVSEAHEELRGNRKPTEIYYVCKTCKREVDTEWMGVYRPDREHGSSDDPELYCEKPDFKPEGVPIEVADAVIRLADYAGIRGFDLALAIYEKNKYNLTREFMHGRTM